MLFLSIPCLLLQIDPLQTAHLANVLSLQYHSGPVVTILVSKSAGRYRIQSEHFHAMHLPLQASVRSCAALLPTLNHVSMARHLCLCFYGTPTALTAFLCGSDQDLAMLQELCQRLQRYFANLREAEPLIVAFEVRTQSCYHMSLWCCRGATRPRGLVHLLLASWGCILCAKTAGPAGAISGGTLGAAGCPVAVLLYVKTKC